jgi:para-aminobenzoate synthetase
VGLVARRDSGSHGLAFVFPVPSDREPRRNLREERADDPSSFLTVNSFPLPPPAKHISPSEGRKPSEQGRSSRRTSLDSCLTVTQSYRAVNNHEQNGYRQVVLDKELTATMRIPRRRERSNGRFVVLLLVLASHACQGFLPTTTAPRHRPRVLRRDLSAPEQQSVNDDTADERLDLRLLLIDHYDSFTYNLVDLLAQYCREPPLVVAADRCASWQELQDLLVLEGDDDDNSKEQLFDGIVLSPGPGNPTSCGPLAASVVAAHPQTPVLGVCLGHQILGTLYGASCQQAVTPVHGQVHALDFGVDNNDDDPLWQGAWRRLQAAGLDAASARAWQVTRYHSLHVTQLEGTPLIPTAYTKRETEGEPLLMALRHVDRPHFGVQFHPESVGSRHGWALVESFCHLCRDHGRIASQVAPPRLGTALLLPTKNGKALHRQATDHPTRNNHSAVAPLNGVARTADPPNVRVLVHRIGSGSRMEAIDVMGELLGEESYRYWLDTADAHQRQGAISILGGATHRVEYWGREHDATVRPVGVHVYEETGQGTHHSNVDILTYLESQQPQATPSATWVSWDDEGRAVLRSTSEDGESNPPFPFWGGYVGYLGYEVRYDTADYLAKLEGGPPRSRPTTQSPSATPTAAFLRADRSYVYHHDRKEWYLVVNVLGQHPEAEADALRWIQRQSRLVREWRPRHMSTTFASVTDNHLLQQSAYRARFRPNRSRETYNDNFDTCLEQIRQGESYELCLTNQLEATVPSGSPLDLYKILRRLNAAPHSAFFDWNSNQKEVQGSSFAVCCSSPERFVSVLPDSDGNVHVEAKPIKGTCARVLPLNGRTTRNKAEDQDDLERAMDLRSSVKNRAENLMIVDLLRNDLSRVCRTGSVHVAKLMDIESFATVHQMVSTIRGTLDTARHSVISVLRACFPGGSMTGAPKLRTMDILHELEEGVPRGLYSGCMGYIGSNGAMDMNIIIRTAVLTPSTLEASWDISVGAGGAITILSESEDEYEEMILKAAAILDAVDEWSSPYTSHRGGANAAVDGGRLSLEVPSSRPQ